MTSERPGRIVTRPRGPSASLCLLVTALFVLSGFLVLTPATFSAPGPAAVRMAPLLHPAETTNTPAGAPADSNRVAPSVTEAPSWANLSLTAGAPQGIVDPLIAYDAARGADLLTGGTICYGFADSSFGCFKTFISNSTWQFEGGRWTNITSQVGVAPLVAGNGYYQGWLAYDAHDQCMVLWTDLGETSPSYLDFAQTWILGSGRWTNVTLDSPNQPGTAGWPAYDPVDAYLVDYTTLGNTWKFSANIWTELGNWTDLSGEAAASAPPYRGVAQMAFDPPEERLVLYGAGPSAGNTWTFLTGAWTRLNTTGPPPPGRASVPIFYDAALGGLIYYGGNNSSANGPPQSAYTWLYTNENWTNVSSDVGIGPPSPFLWGGQSASYPQGGYGLALVSVVPATWPVTYTWALTDRPIPELALAAATTETNQTVGFAAQTFGGQPPITYRFSGLPPGCTAAPEGVFSCRMTEAGSFDIGLNVTDSNGLVGNTTALLRVYSQLAVSITSSSPVLDLGQGWTLAVNASDGRSSYTYAYSGLPPGCSTKLAVLTCVPTVGGVYAYGVVVTDTLGIAVAANGTVTVNPDPAVVLDIAETEGEVNETDTISWTVFGGSAPFLSSISGLPPGCPSSPTPPIICHFTDSGSYRVEVSVLDASQLTVTALATVTVVPHLAVVGFFIWSRTTVPLGTSLLLGTNISGGIGTPTFNYSGLPPGCTSANNYSLGCLPTSAGTWDVIVTVTDARGISATASLSVTVTPGNGIALSGLDWVLVGAGVAAVVVAVGAVYFLRRRRTEGPPLEPSAPD